MCYNEADQPASPGKSWIPVSKEYQCVVFSHSAVGRLQEAWLWRCWHITL